MNFSKLHLSEANETWPERQKRLKKKKEQEQLVARIKADLHNDLRNQMRADERPQIRTTITPRIQPTRLESREYFANLMKEKEMMHLREKSLSNWRRDIQEEHPFVDIMPVGNELNLNKAKKKKEEIENKLETL